MLTECHNCVSCARLAARLFCRHCFTKRPSHNIALKIVSTSLTCYISKLQERCCLRQCVSAQLATAQTHPSSHAATSIMLQLHTHKLAGLNRLNPSSAVHTIMPGIWGCQCTSFMLCCPLWTNSSWAGRSAGARAFDCAARAASSSGSRSRAKSHTASWSSLPVVARILLS